jgi:hypothetical protein
MDSLFDLLFACRHRRTTFPLTPAGKKNAGGQSEKPGDTYVVCLECGKQFLYDWENMRLGKAVDISQGTAAEVTVIPPVPFRTKSKIRYLFWGSAVSAAALVLGKAAHSRRRSRKSSTTGKDHGQDGDNENPQDPRTP